MALAGGWSCFHLAVTLFWNLNAIEVRCGHLAFAVALVYLCFPAFRTRGWVGRRFAERPGLRMFTRSDRPPVLDVVLAVLAATAALYYAVEFEAIRGRAGKPGGLDLVVGGILLVTVLEAARRSLGPALPIVALAFIALSMGSEYLGPLAFRAADLDKIIDKVAFQSGILGTPLDVSARTVFVYVLFGAMLQRVGAGAWFIEMAVALVGGFRGGAAKAAVLGSGFTGIVSGSSIANTVTTGTFTIPLMKRSGYPAVKAGAIEVAASTNGQLMPPVMGAAAFIIAEYVPDLGYQGVIAAAATPAILSYLALIYIVHLEARKLGLEPLPKAERPSILPTLVRGLPYLLPLALLLGLLLTRTVSVELAAVWAMGGLFAIVLPWRVVQALRLGTRLRAALSSVVVDLGHALTLGGRNMMSIAVAVGAAGIIVGVVTMGLNSQILGIAEYLSFGQLPLLLLITAIASLILGMGLPTTANYVVMASLTVPIIVQQGADMGLVVPAIAAHLFCFYFGILADDTPPVGLAAYAGAAISRADPIRTGVQGFTYDLRTAILPFAFIFNTELLMLGITGFWHGALVAVTGLLAMLAFANATQGWVRHRIGWPARILLLVCVAVLLRPSMVADWRPTVLAWLPELPRWSGWALGAGLYAGIWGWQLATRPRTADEA